VRVALLGAGAGGAAAVAELTAAGHQVSWWARREETLLPFQALGGVRHEGLLGAGLATPRLMTTSLDAAIRDAETVVVALPTFAHGSIARLLASAGWPSRLPVVLNPGHTGGALEFTHAWEMAAGGPRPARPAPPVAELSTLTYVARKLAPGSVTVTGRARTVRAASMPGGEAALVAARTLFPAAAPVADVIASGLSNVNLVLHPPGAILAAAWVEATGGDFTFYVEAMTPGVGRVLEALDAERLAVAGAFGHALPNLLEEMRAIGTVEPDTPPGTPFVEAIAAADANRLIKAPGSFEHRYYREDFGHGVLAFTEIARLAGVPVPVAESLFTIAEHLLGDNLRDRGRTAEAMGIAGLSRAELQRKVRGR
jgi:opine dehydrogenase